jgi:hypothetical protein
MGMNVVTQITMFGGPGKQDFSEPPRTLGIVMNLIMRQLSGRNGISGDLKPCFLYRNAAKSSHSTPWTSWRRRRNGGQVAIR